MGVSLQRTEDGTKAIQQTKAEEIKYRLEALDAYRERHIGIGSRCYCIDVDQVEFRNLGNGLVPIAVIELTVIQPYPTFPGPDSEYLAGILHRLHNESAQAELLVLIANALEVPAFVVSFRKEVDRFMVYELTDAITSKDATWQTMPGLKYRKFLTEDLEARALGVLPRD
jgi:hypothetical protein